MPIFETEDKRYRVQDKDINKFAAKYPMATIIEEREGTKYRVKAKDYLRFLDKYPAPGQQGNAAGYTDNMHYAGRQSAEPTEMQRMADAQRAQMGEAQRRADARQEVGDVPEYNFLRVESPKLINAPKLKAPKLTPDKGFTPFYDVDAEVEASMQRIDNAVANEYDAMDDAKKQALQRQVQVNYEAAVKQNAEQTVGGLKKEISSRLNTAMEQAGSYYDDNYRTGWEDVMEQLATGGNPVKGGVPGSTAKRDAYIGADETVRTLTAARDIVQQTEQMIGDYAAQQSMGGAANLGRSIAQTAFDSKTWDFGMGDLNVAVSLEAALDKADKGEALTDAEQLLIDAAVNQQVLQAYYGELSGWQEAGQMFAESLPFMAQIALNPLATIGKYAGSQVAKKVVKHIAKRVGEKGITKILKRGAGTIARTIGTGTRVAGDILGGYGAAMTSNIGVTAADAIDRQIGDINIDFDNNGVARYDGRTNIKEAGEAWIDATNNNAFEFVSESMGAYFAPFLKGLGNVAGKSLSKMGMGAVNRWVGDFAKKGSVKAVQDFFDKTQFHGFAGEYAEEIANGMLNAAFVGDMTMDDVFGKENLIDTAIGLSVMSVLGATISTGAYIANKRAEKARVNQAAAIGQRQLRSAWRDFANAVEQSKDAKQLTDNLRKVMTSYNQKTLHGDDVRAILNYANAYNRYKALNAVSVKAVQDGVLDAEEIELRDLYEKGRGAIDKEAVRGNFELARNNLAKQILAPEDYVVHMFNDYGEALRRAELSEDNGDAQTGKAIRDFVRAKVMHDGMTEYLRENLRAEEVRVSNEVDAITNKKDGNVYDVTLRNGLDGYIIDGIIIFDEQGYVDEERSDELLHVNVNGEVKQITPVDIASVINSSTADEFKEERISGVIEAYEDEYNRMTARVDAVEQTAEVSSVAPSDVSVEDARVAAARAMNVDADELPNVIPDREMAERELKMRELVGDVDGVNAIRRYIAETFNTEMPAENGAFVENVPAQGNVPDFFRLEGLNYSVASRNADGSVDVIVDGKRETLPAGTDYSTLMPTDKKGEVQYTEMPVERTHEYFVRRVKNDKARALMIKKNRQKAEAERKKFEKEPDPGTDPDAYEAKMAEWEEDKKIAQAKVEYWDEVAKRDSEITRSETREDVKNIKPRDVVEQTSDEFIAELLGGNGIKITPESFQRETGLKAEQKQLVGVIAGKDKGGVSIERASEIIWDNYSEELRNLGFKGDQPDVRNVIIEILSDGNPRSYAKKGAEMRALRSVEQQKGEAEAWAQSAFGMTLEELYLYEETILPRIIRDYEGFDETEYYNNLAENYEYDTTRESKSISRGGEVLQGEQSVPAEGVTTVEQRNEGGEISNDVQGSGENGVTQAESQADNLILSQGTEQVGDQVNTPEGDAPGQSGVDPRNMSYDERAKRGGMLRNTPAIDVNEGVITSTKELSARKAAEKWWDENVTEPAFYDTEIGEVEISRNSVESSLAHRYGQAKLDALTSLIEGFENAVYLGSMPDGARHGGVMNHYFAYPINYKGERCYVFCRAMHDANKNRLYVHEVFIADRIKKGDTLQTAASQLHGGIALYKDILANVLDLEPTSASEDRNSVSNSQENTQKSGEIAENGGERMYSQEELAETKEQLGELNATSAPSFAVRLFSIRPWGALKEANAALKELLASYGGTLNGQTLAVISFLDEAQRLISENRKNQEPRSVEEDLDNGDKRITKYNSRGEVETVATERDGKIVAIDSYDEGVLFEHTEYDGNGKASLVTRYDKQGNVVSTQEYINGIESKAFVKETMRTAPLRARAEKWMRDTGVPVRLIGIGDEITNSAARRAINAGEKVTGWIDNNEVVLYLPNISNEKEIDDTFVHEVVAHKGLKALMGKDFDALCDKVWEMMSEEQRAHYLDYPGVNGDTRKAADEYMAHLAEGVDLTEADKTVWQKIVEAIKDFLVKHGMKMSDGDIENLIKASYANLKEQRGKRKAANKREQSTSSLDAMPSESRLGEAKAESGKLTKAKKAKKMRKDLEGLGVFGEVALPKGYKWSDGKKYGNKGETVTALVIGDDLYLRDNQKTGGIVPFVNLNNKDHQTAVIRNFRHWPSIGDFRTALFDVGYQFDRATEDAINEVFTQNGIGFNRSILRPMFRIAEVNERFNNELQQQIDGTLPKGHIYELGMPSEVLMATGIPELPIQLNSTKLQEKSTSYGHDYSLEEIKDLVMALHNPLAVFAYGDKTKAQNIVVEIQSNDKNFVIGLALRPKVGGRVLEINSIRNVFPKDNAEWLNWISQGKALYLDKERVQTLIDQQRTSLADVDYLDLNSIANVINNFENPSIESEISATSQESEGGIRFRVANENQEIFVSNARKAVEGIKQEKATPEQWLAMIQKNGGLKAGEDAWMGLSEWLTERGNVKGENGKVEPVTKQEVLDFIEENSIRIEEVEYSENARFKGQSYYADRYNAGEADDVMPANDTRLGYTTEGLKNKREIALTVPTVEPYNQSDDVHFGDAGGGRAVAWVRFGETTDGEGNRVLVIDEIQSKRHQDGREKGYRGPGAANVEAAKKAVAFARSIEKIYKIELEQKYGYDEFKGSMLARSKWFANVITAEEALELGELRRKTKQAEYELEKAREEEKAVPSAPFEKNWHELAMKRMLRLAAEEEFDKVAWTTGEQQADRYDMSRQVESISVEENSVENFSDGTPVAKNITISTTSGMDIRIDTDAEGVIHGGEYGGKHLSDVVGNEFAERIMQPGNFKLEGEDLRIGGEGMKGFYDRMLPSFVSKYTKKWGAKVGKVTMPNLVENNTMWSVDVTPEMQESVMQGQTMFRIKRTAPETESVQEEHQPSVVSSADGAKVLKNIDDTIEEYDKNANKRSNTFLGDVAKAIGAVRKGSGSQYVTFEAANGNIVTIRLSNHNATVSNFDNNGEDNGISIVVTAKQNNGITNDGNAHITEFFYDAIKLRKADGKPLVEILKSIKQALYSGEYKDNTGLAEVQEVNDDIRFRVVGGNSGYVGYSMSKRAAEARAEGRYPKTDFKKVYNMPQNTLDAFVLAGIIDNSEWHHTSKMGNKTVFYGWNDDVFAQLYALNKEEVDALVKEVKDNIAELEKEERIFLDSWRGYQYPVSFDWDAYRRRVRELEDLPFNERMEVLRSEFPETAEAEKHNSRQREFSSEIDDKKREQMERVRSFFDNKLTEEAERVDAEITEAVNNLAAELNATVEMVTDVNSIQNTRKRASKGWYENGKVYVVLPNADSVDDAVETVLHEVVGHKGLRALFGSRFNDMLDDVLLNASKRVKMAILERAMPLIAQGRDDALRVATEEYMAEQAERGFEDYSLWERIKGWFNEILHSMGVMKEISDEEIRYMLWRSKQLMSKGGTILGEIENRSKEAEMDAGEYRMREGNVLEIREDYEKLIASGSYQAREALQDSMRSLFKVQEFIEKVGGKKVPDWMNAYYMENAMSSINKAEADLFSVRFYNKILDAIRELRFEGLSYDEIFDYVLVKHGIERNREMAVREALTDKNGLNRSAYKDWTEKKREIWERNLNWEGEQKALDDLAKTYGITNKDYSGLSDILGLGFKDKAYNLVKSVENGKKNIKNLWKAINNATGYIIEKQYLTNMMSAETKNDIENMYKYYVPLRGFNEKTAEDVYAYMTNSVSPIASNKIAKGRKSKADNPVAWIASMAESAIVTGNRNSMKNAFFNLVMMNPNDLVTINKKVYLKFDELTGVWEVMKPKIEEDAKPEEVNQLVMDFEERMEKLVKEYPDLYKLLKNEVDIPFRVTEPKDMAEHQIYVKRNGKLFSMTVNGNPRLAQAINGLTNPDAEAKSLIDKAMHVGKRVNRWLSANYTTRNPDFVISNFLRDALYTNTIAWVKESPEYARRFNVNYAFSIVKIASLIRKFDRDKLNLNDPVEKMFYDFVMNGGETGYTNVKNVEKLKKKMMKKLQSNGVYDAWEGVGFFFDEINRSIENAARFAAFMTSREMGRSVKRSIWDAKEISVNFNKKGAGGKLIGAKGQTWLGNIAGAVAGTGYECFVFWNAAIQGSTNVLRAGKHNKGKAAALVGILTLAGFAAAALNGGDDDEDERSYYNLPPYVRRSNLVFRFRGMDDWFTIPLPVEYRAIYGIAEYMTNCMMGKEKFDVMELASNLSQVLPLDMLEGGGGFMALVPSWAKPVTEAYNNVGWSGTPIAKESPFNELDPEYKRVYGNVSAVSVWFSKMLHILGGGDTQTRVKNDLFEWNPAKLEYVINGYLGGLSSFAGKLWKTGEVVLGYKDYDNSYIPLLNRVLKSSNVRVAERRISNEYYKNLKDVNRYDNSIGGWTDDAGNANLSDEERKNARRMMREMSSNRVFFELDAKSKVIKKLNKLYKVTGDDDIKKKRLDLMKEFNMLYDRLW